MTNISQQSQAYNVLRVVPVEVSIEEVERMVAGFPLTPVSSSWSRYINLNSILMITLGSLIVAGGISLLSTNNSTVTEAPVSTPESPIVEMLASASEPSVEISKQVSPSKVIVPIKETEVPQNQKRSEQAEAKTSDLRLPEAVVVQESLLEERDKAPEKNLVVSEPEPLAEEETAPDAVEKTTVTASAVASDGESSATNFTNEDKKKTEKDLELKGFTGVKLLGWMDVHIEQGPFSVSLEGDAELLSKLESKVEGKTLLISAKKGKNKVSGCKNERYAVVHVKMPSLEHLHVVGSGYMKVGKFTDLGKLELALQGSGDMELASFSDLTSLDIELSGSGDIQVSGDVEVEGETNIQLAGSGDIHLHGTTDALNVSLAGSGDIEASELVAQTGSISVVGSGDVVVNIRSTSSQQVIGTGDVLNVKNEY